MSDLADRSTLGSAFVPQIVTTASHFIATDDLKLWLADHGIDFRDVSSAVIRVDRQHGLNVSAWLDVKFLLRDANGNRFAGPGGGEPAYGSVSVPLRYFPALTFVPTKDGPGA